VPRLEPGVVEPNGWFRAYAGHQPQSSLEDKSKVRAIRKSASSTSGTGNLRCGGCKHIGMPLNDNDLSANLDEIMPAPSVNSFFSRPKSGYCYSSH